MTDRAFLLRQFLDARRAEPFRPGLHDCALFAADWIMALTGTDPAARWRGKYDTLKKGRALLAADGFSSPAEVGDGMLVKGAGWMQAQTGDVAVLIEAGNEAMGIVGGGHITAAVDTIPPAVPTGITAVGVFEAIWVKWAPNTESDLSRYEIVERVSTTGPGASTVPTYVTTSPQFISENLLNGETLNYWVRAVDTSGNKSGWSARVPATARETGDVINQDTLQGLIDATSFAAGLEPITVVGSLPTVKSTELVAFNSKIYRWNGTAYIASVATTDVVGEFTAASIAAGAIGADQLAANSVRIGNLLVTDMQNLWRQPMINGLDEDGTDLFNGADIVADPTGSAPSSHVVRFPSGNPSQPGWANWSNAAEQRIPVRMEEDLYVSAMVYAAGSLPNSLFIQAVQYNGSNVFVNSATLQLVSQLSVNNWVRVVGKVKLDASVVDYSKALFRFLGATAQTQNVYITDVRLWRANGAEIVVDGSITANHIASGTISSAEIAAGTIQASNIAAGTITGDKIAANTITAADIAAGTITATEIASSAITTAKLAAGNVTADKIATATITPTQIAGGTITGTKIAGGTITADKIAANTITAAEIAAGAIGADQIAADTITASKVSVGSFDNLNIDADFADPSAWTLKAAGTLGWQASGDSITWGSTNLARLGGAGGSATVVESTFVFDVDLAGESIFFRWLGRRIAGTGSLYADMQISKTADFSASNIFRNVGLVTSTSPTELSGTVVIPPGYRYARFRMIKHTDGTTDCFFEGIRT